MNYREIVLLVIMIAGLSVTLVYAQDTIPVTERFREPQPTPGLMNALFWRTLVIALIAGACGGVVYELIILQGNIELPHRPKDTEASEKYRYAIIKHMYDLGIFARVIIGALAGVIVLLVFSPSTILGLVAISVTAGSAGIAVFNSIQDRLMAALSQRDATETRNRSRQGKAKLSEAIAQLEGFNKAMSSRAAESKVTAHNEILTTVGKLLNEAKGALDTISTE
jgi:hypothetical protein